MFSKAILASEPHNSMVKVADSSHAKVKIALKQSKQSRIEFFPCTYVTYFKSRITLFHSFVFCVNLSMLMRC